MKKIILVLSVLISIVAKSQTWTSQNFQSDGYPASASFPAKTDKSIKPTASDTMMQVTSASGGLTYAFVGSRVKNEQVAQKSIPGIVSRLEAKATKVDGKQASTLGGQPSTLIKYVNQKGSFITIHITSLGRFVYQAFIIKKTAYASDAEANAYFSTVSFQTTTSSTVSTTQLTTPNAVTQATPVGVNAPTVSTNNNSTPATTTTSAWVLNDRVDVFDPKTNKLYGAVIHKINANGTYRVNYDGYAENYDEDIESVNVRPATSATTPANLPFIKLKKGGTVTVKGNLKTGAVMEDLEWAELSSMACWPGIRNVEFQGNQVAYWFDLPKKSIVKITVTPKSPKTRINIYGYSGFDLKKTPPEVSRCTSCEASHPNWIGEPNLNEPAVPQSIEFNATTQRNMVYFAVAGAKNVLEGDYEITIELK